MNALRGTSTGASKGGTKNPDRLLGEKPYKVLNGFCPGFGRHGSILDDLSVTVSHTICTRKGKKGGYGGGANRRVETTGKRVPLEKELKKNVEGVDKFGGVRPTTTG